MKVRSSNNFVVHGIVGFPCALKYLLYLIGYNTHLRMCILYKITRRDECYRSNVYEWLRP